MRNIFLAVAIVATSISFGCGNGDDDEKKSAECLILSFRVDGEAWTISSNTISMNFPKGTAVNNLTPQIQVSAGASVSPASGVSQDFTNDVIYKVTAEDGTTIREYTARAIVAD